MPIANHTMIALLALGLTTAAGDYFLKLAGYGDKFIDWKLFLFGFFLYSLTVFGWFYVFKQVKLMEFGVYYSLLTILFTVAMGSFFFGEKLNHLETAGIVLAVFSLMLLARF